MERSDSNPDEKNTVDSIFLQTFELFTTGKIERGNKSNVLATTILLNISVASSIFIFSHRK